MFFFNQSYIFMSGRGGHIFTKGVAKKRLFMPPTFIALATLLNTYSFHIDIAFEIK